MTYTAWRESNPLMSWMKEKNISQVRTASLLGVKRQTMYYWLVGGVMPTDAHLEEMERLTQYIDLKKYWIKWRDSAPREV